MSVKRLALTIFLGLLLLLTGGVNAIAYRRADSLVHPGKTPALSTPISFGIVKFEDVRYRTRDGMVIAGWYMPGERSAAVILLHGFAANRSQMLPDALLLHNAGFHVLTIDCRACGDSTGKVNTFGYAEVEDVRGAIEYLSEQPGVDPERIGVAGLSQGGSTALLSAAALPEVRAVAAISAFTSLEDNVATGVRNLLNLPPFPFAPLVVFWGEQISGMDLQQVRPVDAVARISPRPVLIIHGETDRLVPVENARRLYAAAVDPKELLIVPGAGHGNVHKLGGRKYRETFVNFFVRWLIESSP
jgi:dipeptidyl aminopeptidase/acylaminoacyl peptidase